MKINFYPDYDNPDFEKAAKEYAEIWEKEGDKITVIIEKISGLKFKEKLITATIHEYVSNSNPLHLQADTSVKHQRGNLVHELCHRITVGNHVEAMVGFRHSNYPLEIHKLTNLIFYDVLVELYGEQFAQERVSHEINQWYGEGVNPYKTAWEWALSKTQEERKKEFRKYLVE